MSRDERMYLQDICESCGRIMQYIQDLDQAALVGDQKTYDAVVRNLEIIGEAARHVSDRVQAEMPDIEWRKIAGMRNLLVHAYFGIDNDILWDVVQSKVPELAHAVARYLGRHST